MVSSFFGLYTAQRSLSTSQTILNVVGNNIANANTPGYSRQRVDLVTSYPYPQPMVGVQNLPGTFGTGAEIAAIARTRDSFLDAQFRLESCTDGYYSEKAYAFESIEGTLMEPSESGITSKMDEFFQSAQELSLYPENLAVRTSFIQQAADLAVVFNQQATSLLELRENLVGDATDLSSVQQSRLGMDIEEINSKLESLADINRQIITLVGNDVKPNDLLDQRDQILDELSEFMPVTIDETASGSVNITLGANLLVSGSQVVNEFAVINSGDVNNPATINLVDPDTAVVNVADVNSLITNGKIGGILEMGGHDPSKVTIRGMLDNLDNLASTIASSINALQSTGQYITAAGTLAATAGNPWENIFEGGPPITAANISVVQDVIDDPNRIAAAAVTALAGEVGNATQALAMAQTRNSGNAALGGATFETYYSSAISALGVQSKSNSDKMESQQALIDQLDLRRESVSGVNMDEELVDLIRFQRSFEASSRVMSTINQILDVIINRMQ